MFDFDHLILCEVGLQQKIIDLICKLLSGIIRSIKCERNMWKNEFFKIAKK